jgi:hypothetical protein
MLNDAFKPRSSIHQKDFTSIWVVCVPKISFWNVACPYSFDGGNPAALMV